MGRYRGIYNMWRVVKEIIELKLQVYADVGV